MVWQRHVLNSVALAPLVTVRARVCDVGSGAGLPGIPVALARPDVSMTLVEPLLRRSSFLGEVTQNLRLPNVAVIRSRAEDLGAPLLASFDVVTARAVAPFQKLADMCAPLVAPRGCIVAIKGTRVREELAEFSSLVGFRKPEVLELPVAGTDIPTIVVRMERDGDRRRDGRS